MKTDKSPSPWMERTNGRRQEHLPGPGHSAKTPDIRPLEHRPLQQQSRPSLQGPDIGRLARTSGRRPGNPAFSPDIRTSLSREQKKCHSSPDIRPKARTSGPSRAPEHPAPRPDIRTPPIQRASWPTAPVRTSGPSSTDIRHLAKAWTSGPTPENPASIVCAQFKG